MQRDAVTVCANVDLFDRVHELVAGGWAKTEDTATTASEVIRTVVAAGPVERPCEVTDERVEELALAVLTFLNGLHANESNARRELKAAAEAALGATAGGKTE